MYEFIDWYTYLVTQQPFELKLTMPPTDRGGRGYSDSLVDKVVESLTNNDILVANYPFATIEPNISA